jgi:protein-tyrosine phosphatase
MNFTALPLGLKGKLYRSVMPFGEYNSDGTLIERYQSAGIDKVVVLAEQAEIVVQTGRNLIEIYAELALNVEHLPIQDFGVPDPNKLRPLIETVIADLQAGRNLVVHCSAGKGRTGLFTACLAKTVFGGRGQEAIDWTREHIPGAIETPEQAKFILAYTP